MTEKTDIEIALEPKAAIPLTTLRWWRELAELNPQDLLPRLDDVIKRLEEVEKVK